MNDETHWETGPEMEHEQGRKREPLFNLPLVIIAILAVATIIEFLVSYVFSADAVDEIYYFGGFIPARYGGSIHGEWLAAVLSPITYAFLHGGWEHLIFNGIWLAAFGSPVAARLGGTRFMALWIVTSVISAFSFDLANMGNVALLVGASGAISGMTGAACRFVWAGGGLRDPESYRTVTRLTIMEALMNRQVLFFAGFWFIANVGLAAAGIGAPGEGQAVAWEAHLGGFISGFFLFPLFDPVRRRTGEH
jgi:membrane associated rhomboid family serine protease